MKQLLSLCAGLLLACGLTGCCCSPGYYDPNCGVMYGGGWEPCCFPNPLSIFACGCGGPGPGVGPGCGVGPGYGVGGSVIAPVGNCPCPCGTYPSVAPIEQQPLPATTSEATYIYGTPEVMPGMPPGVYSPAPEVLPSMPPGVYEESVPPSPDAEPMPGVAPDAPTTSISAPTIIYGPPEVVTPHTTVSPPQGQVQQWVPAHF